MGHAWDPFGNDGASGPFLLALISELVVGEKLLCRGCCAYERLVVCEQLKLGTALSCVIPFTSVLILILQQHQQHQRLDIGDEFGEQRKRGARKRTGKQMRGERRRMDKGLWR